MSPARRTALVSVGAACVLIALKLVTGLATGSLGLISEAAHSGTDLVAALLTYFAVSVAGRPADESHPYGHDKAEHLAALAESAILAAVSVYIAVQAILRITDSRPSDVDATWWAIGVMVIVILVDLARMTASARAARRLGSPALRSNALHFAGDLVGSLAVLGGLLLTRAGHPRADAVAALFVAVLVLIAAGRLARENVDVLMDRAPSLAEAEARGAIQAIRPPVELRRLRMRQAAGRHFADVVIAISPTAALAEGHAVADDVERAVRGAVPGSDVVVHVEPGLPGGLADRALAAALTVPEVREIHNVSVLRVGDRTEVSLHVKLPGRLPLAHAHAIATRVEAAIAAAVPEVGAVHTHLEPLADTTEAERPADGQVAAVETSVERIVEGVTGERPRELRFVRTDEGLVAFLTLGLEPERSLAQAHELGGEIRARIRSERPEIHDVFVHTEP